MTDSRTSNDLFYRVEGLELEDFSTVVAYDCDEIEIGGQWMGVKDARAVRDWLNKVLPDRNEIESARTALTEAGYVGTDIATGIRNLRALFDAERHQFKNFHRLLCERFGCVHDEIDWKRDQVSLIEHIAARAPDETNEGQS